MKITFSEYKDPHIGKMVYDPVSGQSGVVLNIGFEFPYGFAVHIMFESGIYHYIKGVGNLAERLVVMEDEVDLSQFMGLDDPYGKVILYLRERRKKYQKDHCIRGVSAIAALGNLHEGEHEPTNTDPKTAKRDL